MKTLARLKGIVGGEVACRTCQASKACRKPHVGKLKRGRYAMDIVYSDLQGPFQVRDANHNLYQAIFCDSYTDRVWTYLLKRKSDYGATV